MTTGTGTVLHLYRIRSAVRVLLAPTVDATRARDTTWLRQADTALHTLVAHHQALPRRPRATVTLLLDSAAGDVERCQALLDTADLLRVTPDLGDPDANDGPLADVIRHQRAFEAQGRLFDPTGRDAATSAPHDGSEAARSANRLPGPGR